MALGNYIGANTYTTIDEVIYGKAAMFLRFSLYVWSDSSKSTLLASKQYDIYFDKDIEQIDGIDSTTPPENPQNGDRYLIAQEGVTGDWASYEGKIAEWKSDLNEGAGGWSFWFVSPGHPYYHPASELYYHITDEEGSYNTSSFEEDARMWDKWFAPQHVLLDEENNLYKQIYIFLKTLPGFENVTDA